MTDIIKDFEEKISGNMMQFLKVNRDFEKAKILQFREEISVLGVSKPTLIAFGKDAELIAKRNLGEEFTILRIPHYASYISKENYRRLIIATLR